VIGGGDGGAAEEALKHPSIEHLVMVELDGRVVEIAKEHFGAIHRGVFDNPKLKLLIEDGLKYLAETKEKFDYIALDLPDPSACNRALRGDIFPGLQARARCRRRAHPAHGLALVAPRPGQDALWAAGKDVQDRSPYTMFIPLYGCLWSMCVCSDSTDVAAVNSGRSIFESATAVSAICSTTTAPPIRRCSRYRISCANSPWTPYPAQARSNEKRAAGGVK